jgi:hypothetical protein
MVSGSVWMACDLQLGSLIERQVVKAIGSGRDEMIQGKKGSAPPLGLARIGRPWLTVPLAALALCLLAPTGAAVASEAPCTDFCAPIDAAQLDRYRAQGLDAPAPGNTKLGVILWDEYRRLPQPGESGGIVGNAPAVMNVSVGAPTTSLR